MVVDDSPVDRLLAGGLLEQSLGADVIYAEDGEEALTVVADHPPDLILTDVEMPRLDGLSLVAVLRARGLSVPSIVMTAHGSEETAIAALRAGAASYVPKRNLSRRLEETVREVLSAASAHRRAQRLHDSWQQTEFRFCLENDTALIAPLVTHLQQYLVSVQHCDPAELTRVGVALHEALRNAIHHGNLEIPSVLRHIDADRYYREVEDRRGRLPYSSRKVYVVASESRDAARYTIRDDGPGFDPAVFGYDPTIQENVEAPSGRGLFLIRSFMHEVRHNEQGNEITMVHRRAAIGNGSGGVDRGNHHSA